MMLRIKNARGEIPELKTKIQKALDMVKVIQLFPACKLRMWGFKLQPRDSFEVQLAPKHTV